MHSLPEDGRILFYRRDREAYGFLSNFERSPIVIDDEAWATVEHYYQAQKSLQRAYREAIRSAAAPGQAKRLGADPELPRSRSKQSWFRENGARYRADWPAIKLDVMRRGVRAKFEQHPQLRERLLDTGDAQLVEDSGLDTFWGSGGDGTGLNWLGRILMETRTALAAKANANSTTNGNHTPSL